MGEAVPWMLSRSCGYVDMIHRCSDDTAVQTPKEGQSQCYPSEGHMRAGVRSSLHGLDRYRYGFTSNHQYVATMFMFTNNYW